MDSNFSPVQGRKQWQALMPAPSFLSAGTCKGEACVTNLPPKAWAPLRTQPYLSFFESSVDIFILLVLFQLCLHQHLTDVHDFLHRQSQTFHRVTELLLEAKKHIWTQSQVASSKFQPRQPTTWLVAPETEGFSLQTGMALAHSWASHEFQTVWDSSGVIYMVWCSALTTITVSFVFPPQATWPFVFSYEDYFNKSMFRFIIWKGKGNLAHGIYFKDCWRRTISLRLCGAQSGQGKLLVAPSSRIFYSVVPHFGAHMSRPTKSRGSSGRKALLPTPRE